MKNSLILLLLLMVPLWGCATMRSVDDNTQESIERKDNPVLWRKVNILENHAINTQVNTGALQKEIKKLNQEVNAANEKIESLKKQVQQLILQIENEKIPVRTNINTLMPQLAGQKEQNRFAEKRDTDAVVGQRTRDRQVIKDNRDSGVGLQNLQIKVLSGDGHLDSAERMKNKLIGMGYPVRMIDFAPRNNFTSSAVFFASGYREQADQIAKKIGGNIQIKPIVWHTIFNIIVVSSQSDIK
jgi:hypothetical protein